jgi:hypothetical protein
VLLADDEILFLDYLRPLIERQPGLAVVGTAEDGLAAIERTDELEPDALDRLRLRLDTRALHYSTRATDHETCFELRDQQTSVWCVAASVQMVLDFYRYEYAQTRIAKELGLGTLANPNGLPYSRDADVVTVLEQLTGKALSAAMDTTPTFGEVRTEIRANRPVISFIPGHSRVVAGYSRFDLGLVGLSLRGFLVYDPWPPGTGAIVRWEDANTTTYRRAFTAHITLA